MHVLRLSKNVELMKRQCKEIELRSFASTTTLACVFLRLYGFVSVMMHMPGNSRTKVFFSFRLGLRLGSFNSNDHPPPPPPPKKRHPRIKRQPLTFHRQLLLMQPTTNAKGSLTVLRVHQSNLERLRYGKAIKVVGSCLFRVKAHARERCRSTKQPRKYRLT